MPDLLVSILPALAFGIYLASFLFRLFAKPNLGSILEWAGLGMLLGSAFCSFLLVQRLPVYGIFESNLHLALVLAFGLQAISLWQDIDKIKIWGLLVLLLLLSLTLIQPGKFNPDFYMYQVIQVQLFFFLRLTAAGILVLAFIFYSHIFYRLTRSKSEKSHFLQKTAKQTLLLGSLVFLGSELSGTIWCMLGWGDIWHWSKGFFESTAMFLLLMLPFHASQRLKKYSHRALLGAFCTLIISLGIVLP